MKISQAPSTFLLSITAILLCTTCQIDEKANARSDRTAGDQSTFPEAQTTPKQKGAHLFGLRDTTDLHFLSRNNIEWVTLVAWGSQEVYDSPALRQHNGDSLRMQRRDSSLLCRIERVRSAGFQVFLKPHVWISDRSSGKWRSDIYPTSEENWELWKDSYRAFILRYAAIAELAEAELFCVGTEFSRLSVERPAFWRVLIQDVRQVYSGEITYAANWYKEYDKITFWEELDYIGIQAYFPLVDNECPSVEDVSEGWGKYLPGLAAFSEQYCRKILFTELGYKSTADSGITPWEWINSPSGQEKAFSVEAQANCYRAFFNRVWPQDWLAGAHLWQPERRPQAKECGFYAAAEACGGGYCGGVWNNS